MVMLPNIRFIAIGPSVDVVVEILQLWIPLDHMIIYGLIEGGHHRWLLFLPCNQPRLRRRLSYPVKAIVQLKLAVVGHLPE